MNTLVFGAIFFEFMMSLIQTIRVIERPKDKRRLWYLILLLLLILHNLCRIFLPDQRLPATVELQQIVSSVVTSIMAVYFGYYFYKAFNLHNPQIFLSNKTLLSMPFLALFVLPELDSAARLNLLPFLFSGWILYSAADLLIKKLRQPKQHEGDEERLPVIFAAYCALVCWVVIPITSLFGDFNMLNLLLINIGFIALNIVYTHCLVKEVRENYLKSEQPIDQSFDRSRIETNCIRYKFTEREIEVVNAILSGQLNKDIANSLFISTETVKKHISNMLRKACVNSKSELINKLNL